MPPSKPRTWASSSAISCDAAVTMYTRRPGVLVVVGDREHLRVQPRQHAARGHRGARRCRSRTRRPAIIAPTRSRTLSVAGVGRPLEAEAQVHPARRAASRRRLISPTRRASRAQWNADAPAMSVRSRSKKAASVEAASPHCVVHQQRDALVPRRRQAPWTRMRTASPWPPPRADRRAADAAAAPAQLVDERAEDPRAGRADRVAERDRAAVDVDLVLVDAEHPDRVDRDRRERLVDLPEVDVVGRQAGLLERLLRRRGGRPGEVGEVVGDRRLGQDLGEHRLAVALGPLGGGEHERAAAVVDARASCRPCASPGCSTAA